ncbi:aldo/keto reductase [Geomonas sp. Red32]|uniref:aldo/keto reductase n=1 Tax=Geomonas sp. Red32 TaxID=2912856 RepID=UPI00202CD3E6|nr:aldo/keto reductase [Geomonas sp. Red32]MCM0080171.1 aldo/keto reductase [Geomonas sp. Red32]
MQYNRLGNTGLIVSRLAFGAMTFGSAAEGDFRSVYKVEQTLADHLVGTCLDAGINFFDTADAYAGGDSEIILGAALGSRRKEVVISTKAGFRSGEALIDQGLSRHHLMASIEGSLKRLGTDYIDLFSVHRIDPHTPLEETIEALTDIVRQGKARYTGFSNWPAWMAAKAIGLQQGRGWPRFQAAQLFYSLVGRDVERELVPLLEDCQVGMVVWSPLAGGFLSGKYTRDNPGGGGGRLSGFDIIPFDRDKGYQLIDVLREIAEAHLTTVAAVSLAWLLTKRCVASILVGASKLAQLHENLKAASLVLSAEELARLNQLTEIPKAYPEWMIPIMSDARVTGALAGEG